MLEQVERMNGNYMEQKTQLCPLYPCSFVKVMSRIEHDLSRFKSSMFREFQPQDQSINRSYHFTETEVLPFYMLLRSLDRTSRRATELTGFARKGFLPESETMAMPSLGSFQAPGFFPS